jgi:hypothetical protein
MSTERRNSRSTQQKSKQEKEEAKRRREYAIHEWWKQVNEYEAWVSLPHSEKRERVPPEAPPRLKVWLAQQGLK